MTSEPKSLSEIGKRVLGALVSHLPRVKAGNPATYLGYKEVHDLLSLSRIGPTYGESLKRQGLEDIALWTRARGYPGITGIVIDKGSLSPGKGYYRVYGKREDDFEWWKREIGKTKAFDWSNVVY